MKFAELDARKAELENKINSCLKSISEAADCYNRNFTTLFPTIYVIDKKLNEILEMMPEFADFQGIEDNEPDLVFLEYLPDILKLKCLSSSAYEKTLKMMDEIGKLIESIEFSVKE